MGTGHENIIPPKKGEIRNPKGKPKGLQNTKTRLRRLFELVVTKKNPLTGETEQFTGAELMDMGIFAKAVKGDVNAYRELLDRMEGKVSQPVDFAVIPTEVRLLDYEGAADVTMISRTEDEVKEKEDIK